MVYGWEEERMAGASCIFARDDLYRLLAPFMLSPHACFRAAHLARVKKRPPPDSGFLLSPAFPHTSYFILAACTHTTYVLYYMYMDVIMSNDGKHASLHTYLYVPICLVTVECGYVAVWRTREEKHAHLGGHKEHFRDTCVTCFCFHYPKIQALLSASSMLYMCVNKNKNMPTHDLFPASQKTFETCVKQ